MGASVALILQRERMLCLTLPRAIRGPMFVFACIASGFIVACTIFALLVPSGPKVSLCDIARQLETIHQSQPGVSSLSRSIRHHRSDKVMHDG